MKYARVRRLLGEYKLILLFVFLLGVLLLIPTAIAPVFRQVYTDYILLDNARDWLPTLMALMLGMALFSGVLNYLQKTILQRLSNRIEIHGASSYFWSLLSSPLRRFAGADTFTLVEGIGSAKATTTLLTRDIINAAFSLINTALYLFMMFHIDLLMSVIVVALILLNFVVTRLHEQLKARLAARKKTQGGGLGAGDLQRMEEQVGFGGLQNIEMIKSTASEQHFFERMMGIKNALVTATQDGDYAAAYAPTKSFHQILFMNLLLLISALRIMDKEFTLGTYLAFSAYASTLFAPMNQLLSLRKLFRGFEQKLERLYKERQVSITCATAEAAGIQALQKLSGQIDVEGVCFAYEEGSPVLSGFSLHASPGQRIAIVGRSGAGKSTAIRLLQGLEMPDAGTVAYDGIPVEAIDPMVYTVSIGAAGQNIMIFSGSVRQNIALWDKGVTDADIYRAAGNAGLHTYIASLSGAYDYQLAENGRNLSGGQRQKLEIARALLYRPSVVLLDEATTSMDALSIAHVEDALLRSGCTCIVASHVSSLLVDFDEIILLDKGRIEARGTHQQLMAESALYRQLYLAEEGQVAL